MTFKILLCWSIFLGDVQRQVLRVNHTMDKVEIILVCKYKASLSNLASQFQIKTAGNVAQW